MSDTKQALIKDFLESAPLYTPKKIDLSNPSGWVRLSLKEIQMDCGTCKQSKPFHNTGYNDEVARIDFWSDQEKDIVSFQCVTCNREKISFWLSATGIEDEKVVVLQKIGQFPKKKLSRNKELDKFFREDKDEYNKAVTCISHGYGVAAFVYMRRIIEKNIILLLSLIEEDSTANEEVKSALSELKKESPMSDKIAIANKALPTYLLVDGHNPLGVIYKTLSEGVHSLSDEDCLETAEVMKHCIEYMISNLAIHKKSKEEFKQNLHKLNKI